MLNEKSINDVELNSIPDESDNNIQLNTEEKEEKRSSNLRNSKIIIFKNV